MEGQVLRCPEQACTGWISWVEDPDGAFWGCGECGTVWYQQSELNEAIDVAIAAYPYRKKVYKKSRDGWTGIPPKREPKDYEELVEAEWGDEDEEGSGANMDGLRCPVSNCTGWVEWLEEEGEDEPSHWFCGICASGWLERKNLLREIDEIIKKYPYRKDFYSKSGKQWEAAPKSRRSELHDDAIFAEPQDPNSGKLRDAAH